MAEKKESRSIARWDPFAELEDVWPFREFPGSRLARLLDEFPGGRTWPGRFGPPTNIAEDDDKYIVTVELAGGKKDDVTVEMHEHVLTIRGEKKSEREERKEQNRYVERTYGSFSRSFTLPANADASRVSASFKDGVLTVEIPKSEAAKPKVISIKS